MNNTVRMLMMSALVATSSFGDSGETAEERPLTPAYAREVWDAPYEYPGHKFEAVSKVMKRVTQAERDGGTNCVEIAAIEAYFLDSILQMSPATLEDFDFKVIGTGLLIFDKATTRLLRECEGGYGDIL